MAQGPVFLERRSYRLRRLFDAVRLLPLLGLMLWLAPLIWPVAGPAGTEMDAGEGVSTSMALIYIFGIWIGLVVVSFLLWRRTKDAAPDAPPTG